MSKKEPTIQDMDNFLVKGLKESPEELYGHEFPTFIDGDRTYRVFFKKIEDSKSGKAQLGVLTIFFNRNMDEVIDKIEFNHQLNEEQKQKKITEAKNNPFRLVYAKCYLPNYVIENEGTRWIIDEKTFNRHNEASMDIDSLYVTEGYYWRSNHSSPSPENRVEEHNHFVFTFFEDEVEKIGTNHS